MAILPILAEVSDKLSNPTEDWVVHLLVACLFFGLSVRSKRLLVVLGLGTIVYACCNNLLWDDWFRNAIIDEVGYGYVAKAIGVTCTPLLGVAASVPLHLRAAMQARKARPGFCPICGYDLRATPDRCPECGTFLLTQLRK